MENIELFSSRVCPFAHRSRLALLEKGAPFELVEIDLDNKPDWYKKRGSPPNSTLRLTGIMPAGR